MNDLFFAPYTEYSQTAVVNINNVNKKFTIIGFQGDGFGIFSTIDNSVARFVKKASEREIQKYFELFPKILFILVCQTDMGWCSSPADIKSASGSNVEREIIVRNIKNAQRFDTIVARFDGSCFWYEELYPERNIKQSELLRECFSSRISPIKMSKLYNKINFTLEENKAFNLALSSWKIFKKETTQDQFEALLVEGGDNLENYIIRGKPIEMAWRIDSGAYLTEYLDQNTFDVVSSGFCLNQKNVIYPKISKNEE